MTRSATSFQSEPPGARAAGGRRAIAGFLFQILRSLQLGLQATARFGSDDGQVSSMTLTLEPATFVSIFPIMPSSSR
jgi:hypothetical protein